MARQIPWRPVILNRAWVAHETFTFQVAWPSLNIEKHIETTAKATVVGVAAVISP